jgi:hypothetical protein
VALSATLPAPESTAARYFPVDQVMQIAGQRLLDAELISISLDTANALVDYLFTFRAKGWRKALMFCNSRAEVETYAAAKLSSSLPAPMSPSAAPPAPQLDFVQKVLVEKGEAG